MRIHVQNSSHGLGQVTPELWTRVAARLGEDTHNHVVTFGATPADFRAAIGGAEALVTDKDVLAPLLPFNAPHLRLIFVANAGLDNLAPFDWIPPGTALLNNRGAHANKAGEFGIMAILMLASRVPQMVTHQREGRWQKLWGGIVEGRRLTIVGLGALGSAVAGHAKHFGLRVTGVRNHPGPHPDCEQVVGQDGLDAVLPTTEFLVLCCPLTAKTHHLLDRSRIALLPKDAGVINIGRGPLLDQAALCDALELGPSVGRRARRVRTRADPAGRSHLEHAEHHHQPAHRGRQSRHLLRAQPRALLRRPESRPRRQAAADALRRGGGLLRCHA